MIEDRHKSTPPKFGGKMGIWYPLMWRVLALDKWWPPAILISSENDSRVPIDIYVGVCWFLELLFCSLLLYCSSVLVFYFTIIVFSIRICDLSLVLYSELIRTHYRVIPEWASANRKVLLYSFNIIEIFILFAGVHYAREKLFLVGTCNVIGFETFLDAIYFSFVTGTTLGYGDLAPKIQDGWGQILVIVQPIIILVLGLNMISYARSKQ